MPDFWTVAVIAERLQVNEQTVRNWIDRQQLPGVRLGRRVRVKDADLRAFIDAGATINRRRRPDPSIHERIVRLEAQATALADAIRELRERVETDAEAE